MKKYILLLLSAAFFVSFYFADTVKQIATKKIWETSGLATPESVCFDSIRNQFYVSNINGKPSAKDGNGFISKLDSLGNIITLKWLDNLNAPKGLAICGNKLFVADITELLEIDISKGKILKKHKIKKAKFLNDVTCDNEQNVYISDTAANCIFRLHEGNVSCWLKDKKIKKPNGLLFLNNKLFIGNFGNGAFLYYDFQNKKIISVASNKTGIDGIADCGDGEFLVSDWNGKIEKITKKGDLLPLLNLTKQGENAADIFYLKNKKLLLIPTFFGNKIIAYKIKEN